MQTSGTLDCYSQCCAVLHRSWSHIQTTQITVCYGHKPTVGVINRCQLNMLALGSGMQLYPNTVLLDPHASKDKVSLRVSSNAVRDQWSAELMLL